MAGLEQSLVIGQDIASISSDLHDSLFLQSLLQHGSGSETAGTHRLSTMVDTRSRWHHLLDNLCFLCDSEHAGQSVVSVGVAHTIDGVTFWIATADRYQESAKCHLRGILHLLTGFSREGSDEQATMAEITRLSVQRSRDRISSYVNRLERLIPKRSLACEDNSSFSEAMIWSGIQAVLAKKECHYDLCTAAYEFRHSPTYNLLKELIESSASDLLSPARHLVARLGHWKKTSISLVSHTPEFLSIIRNAVVRSVQPPTYEKIGLKLDQDLRDLILRVFPTFKESPMCDALLEKIRRADSLIEWYHSANTNKKLKTKPHAEVVMLEYFYLRGMQFVNDDRYVACSKPSCYCCALYFRNHSMQTQKRPCHGNVWVAWTVPHWEELAPNKDPVMGVLRRMANEARDVSYASFQDGARPRKRFESTIGVTTVRMESAH